MIIPPVAYISLEIFNSWRLFVAVCVIPSLLSVFASYMFVPESPRWLVTKGKKDQALAILRKAAEKNGINPYKAFPEGITLQDETSEHGDFSELMSVSTVLQIQIFDSSFIPDLFVTLSQPRWKKIVLALAVIWGTYGFTFYGSIQTVTRIFDNAEGAELDFDYVAIFVSSSAELLGTYATIQLIDRIGRVKTLTRAFLSAGISLFLLCALDDYVGSRVLVLFAIVGRASEMAAACVTWTVTVELLSTELLATGHSAVNAIGRTGAFFSPYLVSDENSLLLVGSILLGVNLISAIASTHLLETRGVELGKAVFIEEARSQELEEAKAQELVSKYHRMKGKPSFA
jgi:putative MFS transporter